MSTQIMSAVRRSDQSLGRASIAAFGVFVVGAGLTYVAQLVIARIIGPDSYGIYAYALAWVTLLGYVSTLGFHVSILRFVPVYAANKDWALICGVLQYSQRRAMGVGLSIVLVAIGLTVALDGSLSGQLAHTFVVGVAAVPFLALYLVNASAVRAFGGVVSALAPERIFRDALLLAITAIAFWSNLCRLDAIMVMTATLVSFAVMLGLTRISLRRLRPAALEKQKPAFAPHDWWPPTLPLSVITIADNLMTRSGVITLGLVGSTREAGIFAVAFSMATLMALPRMAVATVLAPSVSALFARRDQAGLQALLAKSACLSLVGTSCGAVPLLLFSEPLLGWFGHDFVTGAPVVTLLVVGQLFAAAFGPQQHLITMTGYERTGATLQAVSAVLNFGGCMLMIGWFGMQGAAFANVAALVAWNIGMAAFVYKRLNLLPGLVASFIVLLRRKPCRTNLTADSGAALPR